MGRVDSVDLRREGSPGRKSKFLPCQYLDERGWFRQTKIDIEIRNFVDSALRDETPARWQRIKDALNLLDATEPQAAVAFAWFVYLREFGVLVRETRGAALQRSLKQEEDGLWNGVTSFLEKAAEVGWEAATAITPLGDVIDICAALSGKEGCNLLSGRDLSWQERLIHAGGIILPGSIAGASKLTKRAFGTQTTCLSKLRSARLNI
jgi:hypothetical protein